MEVPRRAFHLHLKEGRIRVGAFSPEFFSENPYRRGKVIGLDGGCTQPLYSVPALGDRLIRPIKPDLKCFSGLRRTPREQVDASLKMEHQSLKALQQGVVQVSRDAGPLVHPLLHTNVELPRQLSEPKLIKCPKHCQESSRA